MENTERVITIFDRVNMAHCAMQRALKLTGFGNEEQFHGEYETARLWSRHRVYNSTNTKFVEV